MFNAFDLHHRLELEYMLCKVNVAIYVYDFGWVLNFPKTYFDNP